MAEFIPSISFTEYQKLNADQLRRVKSFEVNRNGEYLGTWVNGHTEETGYLRTQTEYNCQTANAVGGETLEQILGDIPVTIVKPLKRKRRRKNKAKREKVHAAV